MSLQASGASAALRSAALRSSSSSGRGMATAAAAAGLANKGKPWADYVPVYGALGAMAVSVALGLGTARHELANAPNVRLDKKKRETVPEVAAPELAVDEADRFLRGSLFRRVAHIAQDDPRRDPAAAAAAAEKKAVTLKDAGVEPPGIERSREEVLAGMTTFKRDSANKMNA